MKQFTDSKGNTWDLSLTIGACKRVKDVLNFDLLHPEKPADPDDPRITFSTDNDMVATVSESGLVTPVGGYGTAVITAQAESGAAARFTVNVVMALPEGYEQPELGPAGSEE